MQRLANTRIATALEGLFAKLGLSRPQVRRPALLAAGLWLLAALLALALPVAAPPQLASTLTAPEAATDLASLQEDLEDFMQSSRWGISLQEVQRQAKIAAVGPEGLNPELREMGFVGVLAVPERTSILLILEDGAVQRLDIGDQLPDGRSLAAVSNNRLTLTDANQQRYSLLLFPEVETAEAAPNAAENAG